MSKDIIIFDVETTGFTDGDDITQIGILRIGEDLTIKDSFSRYFNTDINIKPEVIAVTGVNNLKLKYLSNSTYFEETIHEFIHYFNDNNILLAGHNISFDNRMLKANMNKAGVVLPELPKLCTMRALTDEMNIRGKSNKPKFPKLGEAYNYCSRRLGQNPNYFDNNFKTLFGHGSAHDAMYDAYITYVCYAYLKASRGGLDYE